MKQPIALYTFLHLVGALAVTSSPAEDPKPREYPFGPDSARRDEVPVGVVSKHEWRSTIFPKTLREYYVYVPAQYDPSGSDPAALMVFQDGHAYVGETGQMRTTIVFDNLIAAGEMPITIGVFVNPGWFTDSLSEAQGWKAPEGIGSNRSVEYDSVAPTYVEFLDKEILAELAKSYRITSDPARRAICGMSSGGICAFTAAWERPDLFGLVLSHIGSFTNIRGGYVYPSLIRKTERKPIRVFLQDGSHDLDNEHGNWPLSNQEMAAALKFAGYEYEFVFGEGAHNGNHGGAILPDSLRWLWKNAQ